MNQYKLVNVLTELYKAFDQLNAVKFNGELERPTIVISSDSKLKMLGYCTVGRVWKDKDNEEKATYEIGITAEYLNRPVDQIMLTLLHEMVHLQNLMKGIKDCSNNNQYHNKLFKESAEAIGLIVEKSKRYGWSITTECDRITAHQIANLDIDRDVFSVYREPIRKPREKKNTASYKYHCPHCNIKFTLRKNFNLICANCGMPLDVEEKVKESK